MATDPPIIPLSALADVPVTEETQAALARAGIPCPPRCSEMAAQNLLVMRAISDGDTEHPACFGARFDPVDALCQGCPWMTRCWTQDRGYLTALHRGMAVAPAGVAVETVRAALTKAPPPPPSKTKAPPPPPPRRTP